MNITYKEFYDWLMSQDDNKPIDMNEEYENETLPADCGCILIQFARHKEIPMPHNCLYNIIHSHKTFLSLDININFIKECCRQKITTFKQAKEIISSHDFSLESASVS